LDFFLYSPQCSLCAPQSIVPQIGPHGHRFRFPPPPFPCRTVIENRPDSFHPPLVFSKHKSPTTVIRYPWFFKPNSGGNPPFRDPPTQGSGDPLSFSLGVDEAGAVGRVISPPLIGKPLFLYSTRPWFDLHPRSFFSLSLTSAKHFCCRTFGPPPFLPCDLPSSEPI